MATPPNRSYTFEEYLDREKTSEYKSEFHGGEILSMSGGTEQQSRLISRMLAIFDTYLSRCRIYDSNLNLYIESIQKGVYPDCMVLCGEPQFWNNRQDVILNPNVVVEVLSRSTEEYDRGTKAHYYRKVPSIQHILLVSQDRIFVEHLRREDAPQSWSLRELEGREAQLRLLDVDISVSALYQGIL